MSDRFHPSVAPHASACTGLNMADDDIEVAITKAVPLMSELDGPPRPQPAPPPPLSLEWSSTQCSPGSSSGPPRIGIGQLLQPAGDRRAEIASPPDCAIDCQANDDGCHGAPNVLPRSARYLAGRRENVTSPGAARALYSRSRAATARPGSMPRRWGARWMAAGQAGSVAATDPFPGVALRARSDRTLRCATCRSKPSLEAANVGLAAMIPILAREIARQAGNVGCRLRAPNGDTLNRLTAMDVSQPWKTLQ